MLLTECDVQGSVVGIWSSVLGLVAQGESTYYLSPGQQAITGCVQITGRWQGAVTLECAEPMARRAAAAMFSLGPDDVEPDMILDAIGELTNIIAGCVKSLLPEPCQLSLPAVTEGVDYTFRVTGSEVQNRLAFRCEGQPFQVTVVEERH